MAQWIKVLAVKPDDVNLTLCNHVVEGQTKLSSDFHNMRTHPHMHTHTQTHTHTHTNNNFFKKWRENLWRLYFEMCGVVTKAENTVGAGKVISTSFV